MRNRPRCPGLVLGLAGAIHFLGLSRKGNAEKVEQNRLEERVLLHGGTEGSNPSFSTGDSTANLTSSRRRARCCLPAADPCNVHIDWSIRITEFRMIIPLSAIIPKIVAKTWWFARPALGQRGDRRRDARHLLFGVVVVHGRAHEIGQPARPGIEQRR